MNLRPTKLSQIVGQKSVISRLQIALNSAKRRKAPLGHVLFDGPPGLGKTTFATCIANELGGDLQIVIGATLSAPKDIIPYLLNLKENSVFFIDEIHRIPMEVEELLYPAMEDNRVDMRIGKRMNSKVVSLPLPKFTLIGATTLAGNLSQPLRDRFPIRESLRHYSITDLASLIGANARKLGLSICGPALKVLARCSRGTPRVANNNLLWVRDVAIDRPVTPSLVHEAMRLRGIDKNGLTEKDRNYIATLRDTFGGGPAGAAAIAATLSVAESTVTDEIEPYLIRKRLIARTMRGRQLTQKGLTYVTA